MNDKKAHLLLLLAHLPAHQEKENDFFIPKEKWTFFPKIFFLKEKGQKRRKMRTCPGRKGGQMVTLCNQVCSPFVLLRLRHTWLVVHMRGSYTKATVLPPTLTWE